MRKFIILKYMRHTHQILHHIMLIRHIQKPILTKNVPITRMPKNIFQKSLKICSLLYGRGREYQELIKSITTS